MSNKQPLGKCKKHPGYLYKNKPSKTKAYPKGCPRCWDLWNLSIEVEQSASTGKELVKTSPNVEGKNQHTGDMEKFARGKLRKGNVLVERLDGISKGERPGSTVKDELAATKMLIDIVKEKDDSDRPQDITVNVLNLKDTSFADYKKRPRNTS